MLAMLRHLRVPALAVVAALALAACGNAQGDDAAAKASPPPTDAMATIPADTDSSPHVGSDSTHAAPEGELAAADLRRTLNTLLAEHVFFAGAAVNEALQGSDAGFEAAANALDANSMDLAGAVGLVYGSDAGEAFLGLWRSHIGMFVDYTQAVAGDDQSRADAAVQDLTSYANDFAVFLNSANPDLPVETVQGLVMEHVVTTKEAVDSLAAGDAEAGFADLRAAMGHMHGIADPLASAITGQFPDRFPGQGDSPAADLQRDLNHILLEHTYLAGAAVNEALKGNDAGFEGAAAALEGNTTDFEAAIAGVYGEAAGDAFGGLWRSHIGMFVDYTQAVATDDEARAGAAVDDLTGYATDFAVFLNQATGIDRQAAKDLVIEHVLTLKSAVDAIDSGAGNPFLELREAGQHMHAIADPLAATIAEQQGL